MPTPTKTNIYNAYLSTTNGFHNDEDNVKTIVTSNVSKDQLDNSTQTTANVLHDNDLSFSDVSINSANHSANTSLMPNEGISDYVKTGHFLLSSAHIKNLQVVTNPITVTLPNGKNKNKII